MTELIEIKGKFPILSTMVNGKPLSYLDNAASAQKPIEVLEGEKKFYETRYANVHRGIHALAEEATAAYENAREKIAKFINSEIEEVIFTSGTTASINMVANALVPTFQKGDELVISIMEHHSNFVPWQQLAKRHGLSLKIIPITPDYRIDIRKAKELITERTKIVAISHVSNVLGTIIPIKEIVSLAREKGSLVLVDGAQAVAHMKVDVKDLDVDFYTFSSHKLYGPTGVGILYGKKELLEKMPPPAWGGEMVKEVKVDETSWNDIPWRFEPGTPNIAGAVGFGIAIDFVNSIGYKTIEEKEKDIMGYALEKLKEIDDLTIIGPENTKDRGGEISFVLEGVHPHDVADVLDKQGVAVRAGHHCANPLHCSLGLDATTRASIGIYNTREDIDRLVEGLKKSRQVFA